MSLEDGKGHMGKKLPKNEKCVLSFDRAFKSLVVKAARRKGVHSPMPRRD
jgi:hypothetical protein